MWREGRDRSSKMRGSLGCLAQTGMVKDKTITHRNLTACHDHLDIVISDGGTATILQESSISTRSHTHRELGDHVTPRDGDLGVVGGIGEIQALGFVVGEITELGRGYGVHHAPQTRVGKCHLRSS